MPNTRLMSCLRRISSVHAVVASLSRLSARRCMDAEWKEEDHPRGQPGNAGQFAKHPSSLSELTEVKGSRIGGTTRPRLMSDGGGNKFVVKSGNSPSHVQSEYEANQAYQALGVKVPSTSMVDGHMVSSHVDGVSLAEYLRRATPLEAARVKNALAQHFAADVMLSNDDVLGMQMDNVVVDKDGVPWRVDNGGALGHRPQGDVDNEFMAGNLDNLFGKDSQFNQDFWKGAGLGEYFGHLTTHEILDAASRMDWDSAVKCLTGDRRKALEKRVAMMRTLHSYSKSLEEGGYRGKHAHDILSHIHDLEKRGAGSAAARILDEEMACMGMGESEAKIDFGNAVIEYARSVGVDMSAMDAITLAHGTGAENNGGVFTKNNAEALDARVCELETCGLALEQIAAGNIPDTVSGHIDWQIADRAKSELEDPVAHRRKLKTYQIHKAATMLMLSRGGFPFVNNDGTITVTRTEDSSVVPGDGKVGDVLNYGQDPSASYCYGGYKVTGDDVNHRSLVGVKAPISRVVMSDLTSGYTSGGNPFLGAGAFGSEKEICVNATGLPKVFLGSGDKKALARKTNEDFIQTVNSSL